MNNGELLVLMTGMAKLIAEIESHKWNFKEKELFLILHQEMNKSITKKAIQQLENLSNTLSEIIKVMERNM